MPVLSALNDGLLVLDFKFTERQTSKFTKQRKLLNSLNNALMFYGQSSSCAPAVNTDAPGFTHIVQVPLNSDDDH